jgi:hypothetical protein
MTQEMRLLSVEQLRFISDTAYGAGVRASQDELRRLQSVNAQLLKSLEDIASTDPVDAALDPDKAQRIASAAIAAARGQA